MKKIVFLLFFLLPVCHGMMEFTSLDPAEDKDFALTVIDSNDLRRKDDFALAELFTAMTMTGFFAIKDTELAPDLIEHVYHQMNLFFKQDPAIKEQCHSTELGGQRGWTPGEIAQEQEHKDNKEFFHIGREGLEPANIWPEQAGFKESSQALYQALAACVLPIQQAIVATLNRYIKTELPENFFDAMTEHGQTLLRLLYYPAFRGDDFLSPHDVHCWAAEHTDMNLITLLPFATREGLQILINGHWRTVACPSDAIIVNVGDMLQNLTNGILHSARHRVIALRPAEERFSIAFFVHPRKEVPLDPLAECIEHADGKQHYACGTAGEFLLERLLELGLVPHLLHEYAQTGHFKRQAQFCRESEKIALMFQKAGLFQEASIEF